MKTLTIILFFLIIQTSLFPQDQQDTQQVEYDRRIKKYFVVEFIPAKEHGVSNDEKKIIMQNHMKNIKRLVKESKLVMAGPFEAGGGLFIMDVPDIAVAKEIINEDPTVKSGMNTFTVRAWYTERGLFTLEN